MPFRDSGGPDLEPLTFTSVRPSRSFKTQTTTPLSIVDSAVANFSATGAVWFSLCPETNSSSALNDDTHPLSPKHLAQSLAATLNAYPQIAGQLDFLTSQTDGSTRFGRLAVTSAGPGVSFCTAKSPRPLLSLLPNAFSRRSTLIDAPLATPLLDISDFFLPGSNTMLSLHDLKTTVPLPSTQIIHTTHSCGSISLAIKIAHPLADAQALCTFMQDWALTNRTLAQGLPAPSLPPVFEPALLSAHASPSLDPEKLSRLPLDHLDWWANPEDCPWDSPAKHIPPALQSQFDAGTLVRPELGERIPWEEWDTSRASIGRVFHFSAADIERIYRSAASMPSDRHSPEQHAPSRHTALVAHIWRAIVRARFLVYSTRAEPQTLPDPQTLHLTIGLRNRVFPPLPPTFQGSPIINSAIKAPISNFTPAPSSTLADTAHLIHSAIKKFDDPAAIAALLAEMDADVCPWRIWNAFLGRGRCLVTSWVGIGAEKVDFGGGDGGEKLVEVLPLMPKCQGLVIVMEGKDGSKGKREMVDGERKKWYEKGAKLIVYEEEEVMERLCGEEAWE